MASDINVQIKQYQINVTMTAPVPSAIKYVVPSGVIDGANVNFVLPFAPVNFVFLVSDRQPQTEGTQVNPLDFYITGGVNIVMTYPPQASLFALIQ